MQKSEIRHSIFLRFFDRVFFKPGRNARVSYIFVQFRVYYFFNSKKYRFSPLSDDSPWDHSPKMPQLILDFSRQPGQILNPISMSHPPGSLNQVRPSGEVLASKESVKGSIFRFQFF